MNKTFLIIGAIVVIGMVIFKFGTKSTDSDLKNTLRPNNSTKPTSFIKNDKVVIVKNVKLEYLKIAIEQFCNLSNQDEFIVLPRLIILDNKFVITFPYDIKFDQFCFFVNYIKYAHELILKPDYKPDIKAWCTTETTFTWMTDEIVNKKVMIYIPNWDQEYDNVYLTTQDNLGFKMGFALGEENKRLIKPELQFEKINIELSTITSNEKLDFE